MAITITEKDIEDNIYNMLCKSAKEFIDLVIEIDSKLCSDEMIVISSKYFEIHKNNVLQDKMQTNKGLGEINFMVDRLIKINDSLKGVGLSLYETNNKQDLVYAYRYINKLYEKGEIVRVIPS